MSRFVSRVLIGTTRLLPLPQGQVISHHPAARPHAGKHHDLMRKMGCWPIVRGKESCLLKLGLEISNATFMYMCVLIICMCVII